MIGHERQLLTGPLVTTDILVSFS